MSDKVTAITGIYPDKNDVVILDLDRPRELRLGHKALKRFSALTGCSMQQMQGEVSRYDKLALLVYVMLSEDDPDLTPEAVDGLIDRAERRRENPLRIKDVMAAVSAAIQASFSDEDGSQPEDGEDPSQAAGTGAEA